MFYPEQEPSGSEASNTQTIGEAEIEESESRADPFLNVSPTSRDQSPDIVMNPGNSVLTNQTHSDLFNN
jgi:hypothetical protein